MRSYQQFFAELKRPVRTLDALHLASAAHLREHGADVSLATYDSRMREAGVRMGFELYREA